jgi:hypothetical protein
VGPYPVHPDLVFGGQEQNLPGPGPRLGKQDGAVGFPGFNAFFDGVKTCKIDHAGFSLIVLFKNFSF